MSARQMAEAFKKLNPDYTGSVDSLERYYAALRQAQHSPPEHLKDLFQSRPCASHAEVVETYSQLTYFQRSKYVG